MIIRRRYTANFTTIGNVLFEDERLAADELGILAYLRSRPHDWEVRRPALMRRFSIGREALRRIIRNLVRYGWCRPERKRLDNGTTFVIYEIRDEPGPELTEEEAKRVLSLESSEASSDQNPADEEAFDHPHRADEPPTGYPSLADPPPVDPSLAYIDIQNKDLPKTDSTQKIEREHAREKEKHALNLAEFKRRWPTIAADDQTRIDNAWFALTLTEGEAALAGIAPFMENQKRLKKSHPPAGFNYLGQKRWTLLEASASASPTSLTHPPGSPEARAIAVLHEIAGRTEAFRKIWRRSDGSVVFPKPVTAQLLALSLAPPHADWKPVSREGAGSWEGLLREFFEHGTVRSHLREGSLAPGPFVPSAAGKFYKWDELSERELADFK